MTTKNYGLIRNLDELKKLTDHVMSKPDCEVGFDVETGYDGDDRERGALGIHTLNYVTGFSFTNDPSWARYVPIRHDYVQNVDEEKAIEVVKPLLETHPIIAHNLKFEAANMANYDVTIDISKSHCTLVQAFCLSDWELIGLKPLVAQMFGHQMTEIYDLFPGLAQNKRPALRFNVLDLSPKVVAYACEDSAWCLGVHKVNWPRVQKEREFVYKLEMQVMETLLRMEKHGVAMDWDQMRNVLAEAELFIPRMEMEVKAQLGAVAGRNLSTLNLASPKQIQELFFGEFGWKSVRKTKAGKDSTDAVALEKLSKTHPAVKHLLELREVKVHSKRVALWLEKGKAPKPVIGRDERVHSNYAQTVVGTGRFAANDPPIQQCPKHVFWCVGSALAAYAEAFAANKDDPKQVALAEEAARKAAQSGEVFEYNFRDFITCSPGTYLLGFDYSQIELRFIAGLAGEKTLIDAFNRGDDIHSLTASLMLGKPVNKLSTYDRQVGKTMNFALIYGMGPGSLADRLAMTKERAVELFDLFHAAYPAIEAWSERQKAEGESRQYTTSWIGRRYTVWELKNSNKAIYAKGVRVLVNSPVQGGAADYMKITMMKLDKIIETNGWRDKVHMVMNQHDALTFEVSIELNPQEVRTALLAGIEWKVKKLESFPVFSSDWEFGYRWGSMVPIGADTVFEKFEDRWTIAGQGPVPEPPSVPATTDLSPTLLANVEPTADELVETFTLGVAEPKTLIVETSSMPTNQAFSAFMQSASSSPGVNHVVLKTPQGEVPLNSVTTNWTPEDQPQISILLSGARAYWTEKDVDVEALGQGLMF